MSLSWSVMGLLLPYLLVVYWCLGVGVGGRGGGGGESGGVCVFGLGLSLGFALGLSFVVPGLGLAGCGLGLAGFVLDGLFHGGLGLIICPGLGQCLSLGLGVDFDIV
jgi:hypothetical protein